MSVEIEGFSDTDPRDVGLVVVGPTGAALAIQGACGGSTNVLGLNLVFSDAAASQIPQNTLFTGTYKPTQYASIGSFPSPGPGLTYHSPAPFGTATLATTFDGSNPNGTWSFYAIDPVSGDSGEISNGWILQVHAVPVPGDFNRDGRVDAADILPAMKALTNPATYELQYGVSPADLPIIGNVNGDGVVNNFDLQALISLVASGGGNGSLTVVPEPASIVLLGLGALAIAYCRSCGSTALK